MKKFRLNLKPDTLACRKLIRLLPLLNKAEPIDGPVTEDCFPVDQVLCDKAPVTAVIAGIAMISQNKILSGRNRDFIKGPTILELWTDIRLTDSEAIYIDGASPDFHFVSRQSQHSLYKGFAAVSRIPEDHNVAPADVRESINKAVDEDPLLVHQVRLHARALDFDRLDHKNDDENRYGKSDEDIAEPGFYFGRQMESSDLRLGFRFNSVLFVHLQTGFFVDLYYTKPENLSYQTGP